MEPEIYSIVELNAPSNPLGIGYIKLTPKILDPAASFCVVALERKVDYPIYKIFYIDGRQALYLTHDDLFDNNFFIIFSWANWFNCVGRSMEIILYKTINEVSKVFN